MRSSIQRILVVLGAFAALAFCTPISGSDKDAWEAFKSRFNKTYGVAGEEQRRMNVFLEKKRYIDAHNEKFAKEEVSYEMGINAYSDLTVAEIQKTLSGCYKAPSDKLPEGSTFTASPSMRTSDEVDWRKKGAVTPIKNQLSCGSCWAFSSTGALEGQHFIKTRKLVSLSEQNLVDCDTTDLGCDGGNPSNAFMYVKNNNGIDTEQSYPYTGKDGRCNYSPSNIGATDSGFTQVTSKSEEALKQAVYLIGPISVAIDASHDSFQSYHSGIYYEPACSQDNLDHAVLAVGYGTEGGKDYWLVKNSWGTSWGIQGYIKMARNRDNNCGIATYATYPIV